MKNLSQLFRLRLALLFVGVVGVFYACKEDTRNYEAELVSIHFVKRLSKDTVLLVSDTLRPLSTTVAAEVSYVADLSQLVPIFTLSSGATANCESGATYDFTKPFTLIVTSENERNQRQYTLSISKLEAPPVVPPKEEGKNSEAWLSDFKLEGIENAEYEPRGTRIKVVVPEDTDLTALKPQFTISEKATCDWKIGETFDFSEPLYIRVTSEDQRTSNTFRISVRLKMPPQHEDAQILSFRFAGTQTDADIDGSQIYAEAARGSDLRELVPIIKVSEGATLSIAKGVPIDFSAPVSIDVISEDGAAKSSYTVHTTLKKYSEARLMQFQLLPLGEATITEPHRFIFYTTKTTNLLYPLYEVSTGASVNLKQGEPLDFSDKAPKELIVTSEDGFSTNSYEVIVVEDKSTPNERGRFTSFLLDAPGAETQIIGTTIVGTVPAGTDVTHLKANFAIHTTPVWENAEGPASVWLGKDAKAKQFKSGETEIDCTNPVSLYVYRKFWGVSYYKSTYTLTVTIKGQEVPKAEVEQLAFDGIQARISRKQNTFLVFVGNEVNLTQLKPMLTLSPGATATLASGVECDFSSPVSFTVTAADGKTTSSYRIVVSQRTNDKAVLSDVTIDEINKAPVVSGATYTFFAGGDVDVKNLTLRFKLSEGATCSVASGAKHDFSKPVRLAVTSQDKSITRSYLVVVDQRLNYEAELLSFGFRELKTPCKISGSKVTFPSQGLDLKALTPYYTISIGAKCSLPQNTPADFSAPVRIIVTSEDGFTTKAYTVQPELQGITFDFERWTSISDFEHPLGGWSSSNVGLQTSRTFTGKPEQYSVRKTSEAHTGSYAAQISTEELGVMGKSIASGALFLGTFDATNIVKDPLSGPRFGIPWIKATPVAFVGWYKYVPGKQMVNKAGKPIEGVDELDLYAVVFYGDVLTSHDIQTSDRVLYKARLTDLSAKNEYTRFELPFEPTGATAPAGAQLRYTIVASSSRRGDDFIGAIGSRLLLDDLEISYK